MNWEDVIKALLLQLVQEAVSKSAQGVPVPRAAQLPSVFEAEYMGEYLSHAYLEHGTFREWLRWYAGQAMDDLEKVKDYADDEIAAHDADQGAHAYILGLVQQATAAIGVGDAATLQQAVQAMTAAVGGHNADAGAHPALQQQAGGYTDGKLAAHNTDTGAHRDIRDSAAQDASDKVGVHNTAGDAHADIRSAIGAGDAATLNGAAADATDKVNRHNADATAHADMRGVIQQATAAISAGDTATLQQAVQAMTAAVSAHDVDGAAHGDIRALVAVINALIPAQATPGNQLVTKDFMNSSLNAIAAHRLSYNAGGDRFPTKADLINATACYYNGEEFAPTVNDYTVVAVDESENGAEVRYRYTGSQWVIDYVVNDTPFTDAQNKAIDSGMTAALADRLANPDAQPTQDSTRLVTSGGVWGWFGEVLTNLPTTAKTVIGSIKELFNTKVDKEVGKSLITDAERIKLDGIAAGADVTATAVGGAAEKTAPADSDMFSLLDTALKKIRWGNIKAALKSYFDGLYAAITHTHTKAAITDFPTSLPANGGCADVINMGSLTPGTDILAYIADLPIGKKKTVYGNTLVNAPENRAGTFIFDIYPENVNWRTVEARTIGYQSTVNVVYLNTMVNGVWTGWVRTNDDGDAMTVNGKTHRDYDTVRGVRMNGLLWDTGNLADYVNFDNANRAAAAMGKRLPTQAEYAALAALPHAWDAALKGMWFAATAEDLAEKSPAKCLFFPAVGDMDPSGLLVGPGILGFYWSQSEYSSADGYYLCSLANGNVNASTQYHFGKNYGLSVRCVQDGSAKILTADAVVNQQNGKSVKKWAGSQAQWDALGDQQDAPGVEYSIYED